MGCCSTKQASVNKRKTIQQKAPPRPDEAKTTSELFNSLKQVSGFNCQLVTLIYVHNYLCFAREAKKAQWVVFFDVSQS
jgi:hypothetical protein